MIRRSAASIGLALLILSLGTPAEAKDNTQHIAGIGFQGSMQPEASADALLSVKFAAAPTVEFAALVGMALTEDYFVLSFGGKALYILIPEEHVNVYVAATGYPTVGSRGLHHFNWLLGPGLAWYPPGAKNLEIFAEFGLGGTVPLSRERDPSVPGPTVYLTTTGTVALGLHYWF
jgi:hypothetical protein